MLLEPPGVFLPDHRTRPQRIAMLSVHTSPLESPGSGDAGGLNVYVVELARRLASRGIEVEVFTRATSAQHAPTVELSPGVSVHHVVAGPLEGLRKEDLPGQLCAFTAAVMRTQARHGDGWYDLVHSHYWLSGLVGWLVADRWNVPLVHSMHTLGKVKNAHLAQGDTPEPDVRLIGEGQVVDAADMVLANTETEAAELRQWYEADPDRIAVVPPGVDVDTFRPTSDFGKVADRQALGLDPHADVIVFAGRVQPLKGPDVLVRAAAHLAARNDEGGQSRGARPLQVVILGGPSGTGANNPDWLQRLAYHLRLTNVPGQKDIVRFEAPVGRERLAQWLRAADLVAVPSYNESFGLVALEAQACGTPVVAAAVGGLHSAVQDHVSGVLVPGHSPMQWAQVLGDLLDNPARRLSMAQAAVKHAHSLSWDATVDGVLHTYADARQTRLDRMRHEIATRDCLDLAVAG